MICYWIDRLLWKDEQTLKPRLHEQYLCDKFYLFASVLLVYKSNFSLKTKDWKLGSTDDIKNAIFKCCLVYTVNFLYVTIFICHIETNTPVFQQINNCHKNCHIKIAHVEGAQMIFKSFPFYTKNSLTGHFAYLATVRTVYW